MLTVARTQSKLVARYIVESDVPQRGKPRWSNIVSRGLHTYFAMSDSVQFRQILDFYGFLAFAVAFSMCALLLLLPTFYIPFSKMSRMRPVCVFF